jgi:hypothetical protein
VNGIIALVFLQFVSATFAGTRIERSLRDGADIAAFREIASAGLSAPERHSAFRDFVHQFPDSSLAEVALAECIEEGEAVDQVLADLKPVLRNRLVSRYRLHYEKLAGTAPDGPAVTWDDESADSPSRHAQTKRNMRRSSR